jgi:hypothetical protein
MCCTSLAAASTLNRVRTIQKLARIGNKRRHCLETPPAYAGKVATPLFDRRNRTLRLSCFKLIQCGTNSIKVVACLPEQRHNAQAA